MSDITLKLNVFHEQFGFDIIKESSARSEALFYPIFSTAYIATAAQKLLGMLNNGCAGDEMRIRAKQLTTHVCSGFVASLFSLVEDASTCTFIVNDSYVFPWHLLYHEDKFLFEHVDVGIIAQGTNTSSKQLGPFKQVERFISGDLDSALREDDLAGELHCASRKLERAETSQNRVLLIGAHGNEAYIKWLKDDLSHLCVEPYTLIDYLHLGNTTFVVMASCAIGQSPLFSLNSWLKLTKECAGLLASGTDFKTARMGELSKLADEIVSKGLRKALHDFHRSGIPQSSGVSFETWRLAFMPFYPPACFNTDPLRKISLESLNSGASRFSSNELSFLSTVRKARKAKNVLVLNKKFQRAQTAGTRTYERLAYPVLKSLETKNVLLPHGGGIWECGEAISLTDIGTSIIESGSIPDNVLELEEFTLVPEMADAERTMPPLVSETEKSILALLNEAKQKDHRCYISLNFNRDKDGDDEDSVHGALRNLRRLGWVKPRESGSWREGKQILLLIDLGPLLKGVKPIETDEIMVLGPPDPPKSKKELLAEDCLKGRFGGKTENEGWKITAKVDSVSEKWCRVELAVTPPPGNKDATHVTFFLPPPFIPSVVIVPLVSGSATLVRESYGAFTVGVECGANSIPLELDLADHTLAPADWRDR